ncbi:hypothetical protein B0H13DRAFT_2527297 [Mycena leptocephala]|nr:hypothetical protein B0H13DRAFT_2527297 [Mycena leptocephala]
MLLFFVDLSVASTTRYDPTGLDTLTPGIPRIAGAHRDQAHSRRFRLRRTYQYAHWERCSLIDARGRGRVVCTGISAIVLAAPRIFGGSESRSKRKCNCIKGFPTCSRRPSAIALASCTASLCFEALLSSIAHSHFVRVNTFLDVPGRRLRALRNPALRGKVPSSPRFPPSKFQGKSAGDLPAHAKDDSPLCAGDARSFENGVLVSRLYPHLCKDTRTTLDLTVATIGFGSIVHGFKSIVEAEEGE